MTDGYPLDLLLTASGLDPGCEAVVPVLDQYTELELAGEDAGARLPGVSAHLGGCAACRADHDGLLHVASDPNDR